MLLSGSFEIAQEETGAGNLRQRRRFAVGCIFQRIKTSRVDHGRRRETALRWWDTRA